MKRNNLNILLAVFMILIAVSARIINAKLHIPNIVPITAIGLFSGAVMKDNRKLAFLTPLLGQFLADVYFHFFTNIPGFYDIVGQLFNYGALFAATALGTSMKNIKPVSTLAYLLGASTLFFIVSNFGYFMNGWNGYSVSGLIKTYVDGIPFFKYTLAGDMVGGVLFFGSYLFAQQSFAKKAQKVNA